MEEMVAERSHLEWRFQATDGSRHKSWAVDRCNHKRSEATVIGTGAYVCLVGPLEM